MRRILLLILLLLFFGCSPKIEKVIKTPDFVQLPDITGKKSAEVQIYIPSEIIKKFNLSINSEKDIADFTFTKKFSSKDIKDSQGYIRLVEELTGLNYPQNFNNIYWSDDLLKAGYLGMTIYSRGKYPWSAYIAIASELKVNNKHSLNEIRDIGLVLVHEFSHAAFLHSEEIVKSLIDTPIHTSFHTKLHTPTQIFYFFNEIGTNNIYTNLLEEAAFKAKIPPPWIYQCDVNDNITLNQNGGIFVVLTNIIHSTNSLITKTNRITIPIE